MQQFRVVIVRDLSEVWEEPDADQVVRAATAHAAAREVLRSLGGGFVDSIEVHVYEPRPSRVQYLYCNRHAGELTFDLCCVPRKLFP